MQRIYTGFLENELASHRQMLFISGPRQVGKTTLAKELIAESPAHYFNWDNPQHRQSILLGASTVAGLTGLDQLQAQRNLIAFDELHKYKSWKDWLKGFFDLYEKQTAIVVTGSAQMDIFRKGGDSLMGRYFHYRMHPLSLRELSARVDSDSILQELASPDPSALSQLLQFGGFPEPFLLGNERFYNRWQKLRQQQLIHEDIRDSARIQEIAQLEILARLLQQQSGQVMRYSTLSKQIAVSVDTVRRWLVVLEGFYYCYRIRPWFNNIATALRKEPKVYLWDWSQVQDKGARYENFIASHLLKAVHWWTDLGFGEFELYYLRTKDQKEVDFLVARDGKPWFLVEAKSGTRQKLNPHLEWFQQKTGAEYAFQVVMDLPFAEVNCFSVSNPVKVPVESLLMRLV